MVLTGILVLSPPIFLTGIAYVLARKIVTRGAKDYRKAELIDEGKAVRIALDEYTRANGRFGIFDPETQRHTRVGGVSRIDEAEQYVERDVDQADGAGLTLGPVVDWTPDIFFKPSAISKNAKEVLVPTSFGNAPAWIFPGETSTWVIHIHGSWTDRAIMLRDVDAFKSLEFTSLVPTFRSDPEVDPPQPDLSHLGQTEWLDVDSAIAYAVAHGAERIVLSGWSMGGTIALLAAERSKYKDKISALVLVGPVTSWAKSIVAGATRVGVPAFVAKFVIGLLEWRTFSKLLGLEEPINFRTLEWIDISGRVTVPTLVLQSKADKEVPWELSVKFQKANKEKVTLITLADSLHTQEWNTSPAEFTGTLTQWIKKTL